MAFDIAAGLAFLSEQKYVHRDIACRNCLVNAGRSVKLADFGMTRPMFESDYYRFSRRGTTERTFTIVIPQFARNASCPLDVTREFSGRDFHSNVRYLEFWRSSL